MLKKYDRVGLNALKPLVFECKLTKLVNLHSNTFFNMYHMLKKYDPVGLNALKPSVSKHSKRFYLRGQTLFVTILTNINIC